MTVQDDSYSDVSLILRGVIDKPGRVCLACLIMILWQPLSAQPQPVLSPLECVISDKDKRETLSDQLQVSHAQAGAFWKIYEDYERDRRELLTERLKLINKHHEVRSAAAADKKVRGVVRRLLMNDVDYREMYKTYYSRAALIVGSQKALQFIYIEEYFQLRTNVRLDSMILGQNHMIASKGGLRE